MRNEIRHHLLREKVLVVTVAALPVGVNVPLAFSLSCLAFLSRRLPAAVSLSLSLPVPAAGKDTSPEATRTGLAAACLASLAPAGTSYQSMTATPASRAVSEIVRPPLLSSDEIFAALPDGVSCCPSSEEILGRANDGEATRQRGGAS